MARGLGTLTLDLIARTGGFVEGMGKAERQVRRGTRRMESDFQRFAKQSRAAMTTMAKGVAVGVAAAVASLSALYVSGARSVEQLSRMSDRSEERRVGKECISSKMTAAAKIYQRMS